MNVVIPEGYEKRAEKAILIYKYAVCYSFRKKGLDYLDSRLGWKKEEDRKELGLRGFNWIVGYMAGN